MITSPANYMPKTQEYYDGFNDGYEVAKQEVHDFYKRMGKDNNCFTGTVCASITDGKEKI